MSYNKSTDSLDLYNIGTFSYMFERKDKLRFWEQINSGVSETKREMLKGHFPEEILKGQSRFIELQLPLTIEAVQVPEIFNKGEEVSINGHKLNMNNYCLSLLLKYYAKQLKQSKKMLRKK